jgi:hypothetical protein
MIRLVRMAALFAIGTTLRAMPASAQATRDSILLRLEALERLVSMLDARVRQLEGQAQANQVSGGRPIQVGARSVARSAELAAAEDWNDDGRGPSVARRAGEGRGDSCVHSLVFGNTPLDRTSISTARSG